MDMKYLKVMVQVSHKAVNEMLTPLAAGALAGNEGMTGEAAARVAIECSEKLLAVTMAEDGGDDD